MQLASNFLGHFVLAGALHGSLRKAGSARIVVVAAPSRRRHHGCVRRDGREREPHPSAALQDSGAGAATSVRLTASPLLDAVTGRYFEDNQEAQVTQADAAGGGVATLSWPASTAPCHPRYLRKPVRVPPTLHFLLHRLSRGTAEPGSGITPLRGGECVGGSDAGLHPCVRESCERVCWARQPVQ